MEKLTPEEYRKWNREEGFMPRLVGDAEKCVCVDCVFRARYHGDVSNKTQEWLEKCDINFALKCVCKIYSKDKPNMYYKPDGILEGKGVASIIKRIKSF